MTNASNEKWQRYEQALLKTMGFDQFPSSIATTSYQLLIIPAFHALCCLRLALTDQDGEFSFSLLVDRSADLFDTIWRKGAEAEALAGRLAKRACLEASAHLNAVQAATFRQHLATLEPMTFHDSDLTARDGVSIRCDCQDQNTRYTFSMRSPTAKEAPRHTALSYLFVEAAQKHFHHPQIQDYLAVIAGYFH